MTARKTMSDADVMSFLTPRDEVPSDYAYADPLVKSKVTVTLDQLMPYDGNPRTVQNPKYFEIKTSIRARGLGNTFNRRGDRYQHQVIPRRMR